MSHYVQPNIQIQQNNINELLIIIKIKIRVPKTFIAQSKMQHVKENKIYRSLFVKTLWNI